MKNIPSHLKEKLPKKKDLEEKLIYLISDPETSDTAVISAIKTLVEIAPEKGIERLLDIYNNGEGKNQIAVIKYIYSIIPKEKASIDWDYSDE